MPANSMHLLPRSTPGKTRLRVLGSCALILALCASAKAQTTAATGGQHPAAAGSSSVPDAPQPQAPKQAQDKEAVTVRNTPRHVLKDQVAIWTSPAHIRTHDLVWLAPLAVGTGVGIATDHHMMASVVSHDPSFNQSNVDASNVLIGGFIAAPVALYGWGYKQDDPHAREAGILGSEALVDGVAVEEVTKLIFRRERPVYDNARGLFFSKNAHLDSSFPSSHSVLAWSSAAVIAAEYPSRWTQLGVYSLATGVSVTRVLGREHFPADVLVGSAVGWLVGHYVYRAHHHRVS